MCQALFVFTYQEERKKIKTDSSNALKAKLAEVNKNMPKVYITREIPEIGPKMLQEKGYEVATGPEGKTTREELLSGVKGVDAILSVLTEKIDAEVLDAAGDSLKL